MPQVTRDGVGSPREAPQDCPGNHLYVTNVSSFIFCERKCVLEANHVQPPSDAAHYALGTIEHELRRKMVTALRPEYLGFVSGEDARALRDGRLVDIIVGAASAVRGLARATHPLHFDLIDSTLKRLEGVLLDEETARVEQFARLVEDGAPVREAVDNVLPAMVERGVASSALGLTGRVDQVWSGGEGLEPVDLKTCPPEVRPLYEESYWIQAALYGLLLAEEHGANVPRVGLHYTVDGRRESRLLDAPLRAHAVAALKGTRNLLARGGLPPMTRDRAKCFVCPYETMCHGGAEITLPQPARTVALADAGGERAASPDEATFAEFHRELHRLLRSRKTMRADLAAFVRRQRHLLPVKHGGRTKARIPLRRLVKGLGRLVETGTEAISVEAYFGGPFVQFDRDPTLFRVITREREVRPWIYIGNGDPAGGSRRAIVERCLGAERDTGCHCTEAVLVNSSGGADRFAFGEAERALHASVIVSEAVAPPQPDAIAPRPATEIPPATNVGAPTDSPPPAPPETPSAYIGFISEDQYPLRFTLKQDTVHAFLAEEHREALAKGDYVIAEPPGSNGTPAKHVFLRVLEIASAPVHAGTLTRSVKELVTRLVLEPLSQTATDRSVQPVRNDDLHRYLLRKCTAQEIRDFLGLPAEGWPLGVLASCPDVVVNLPVEPRDALFRSVFVVGAKGKGKTSFSRQVLTLLTGYGILPAESRPAVVILDGEPPPPDDVDAPEGSSEFNESALHRAYGRLVEQLGDAGVLEPAGFQEVRFSRSGSGLRFGFGDIDLVDIPLLLPDLTDKSADVLHRLLESVGEEGGTDFERLADLLAHVRAEVGGRNGQIDRRIGQAIARALMSPSVQLFERSLPNTCSLRDLVKPGTVTVLNVTDLDEQQRRLLSIYLFLAFEKLALRDGPLNLLLVLDEAERVFPGKRAGHSSKTTIQRVASKVAGIARRGRRRRFGMMICTQYPADVDREIVGNCDIRTVFCLAGQDRWVREALGPEHVHAVKRLPTGHCFIDLRKVSTASEPLRVRLFMA